MSDRTLALLYPGCVSFEIALALELLNEKLPVETAGPPNVARIDCAGLSVVPRHIYADVKAADYRAILVPGGDPEVIMRDREVDRILYEADEQGLVIGGICGGVLVLAKAGLTRGRRITHTYTAAHGTQEIVDATERFFEHSEFVDAPLVWDANVVTAKPDAYVEFAVEIADRLGVLPAGGAPDLAAYYRGRQ